MASNEISRRFDLVVQSLEDAADGAHNHGVAVDLKQNDETAIRAILDELVGKPAGPGNVPPAVPGLKDKWNVAKAAKVAGTSAFASAKKDGQVLARACISVLKPRLGDQWNNAWQAAGFTNHSIAVPANPLSMLQQCAPTSPRTRRTKWRISRRQSQSPPRPATRRRRRSAMPRARVTRAT